MRGNRRAAILLAAAVTFLVGADRSWAAEEKGPPHPPLGQEGIYDPTSPGLEFLQQPDSVLRDFPPDRAGNFVNWVETLRGGYIDPRRGLKPNATMNTINMDVMLSRTGSMPQVKYPHKQHTEWLACTNCHPSIFLPQKDGNPITMYSILKGEFCGVCHGKVAFPIYDCFRCHNTPQDSRILFK
ncbi:MAG: c(7)-type cytochrome triheme domain-containing protein [Alphaproteobacteria bacterium]